MTDGVADSEQVEQKMRADTLRRTMRTFAGVLVSLAVCLFVPAGDLGWVRGWAFLLVFFVLMTANFFYLWRTNPELLAARSRSHRGSKPWDKLIVGLLFLSLMAIYPVAGLDDGRFHWSSVPLWLAVVGFVLLSFCC
jgi:hypothetical protein